MQDCPSAQCSGGAGRAYEITDPMTVALPQEIWESRGGRRLWKCGYCGFLWFTEIVTGTGRPFVDIEAIGDLGDLGTGYKIPKANPWAKFRNLVACPRNSTAQLNAVHAGGERGCESGHLEPFCFGARSVASPRAATHQSGLPI